MGRRELRSRDEAIQVCIDRVLDGHWSIDECLEQYPQYSRDLLELIPLLQQLQTAATVKPRPEFRRTAVRSLQRRLDSRSPRIRGWPVFPWLANLRQARPVLSLAAGMAMLLVIFGAVSLMLVRAADAAMPGDALYRLDLGLEETQLSFSREPRNRSHLRFKFAQERLDEATALAGEGQRARAQEALVAYGVQMQEIEYAETDDAEVDRQLANQEEKLEIVYSALVAPDNSVPKVDLCAGTTGDVTHPAIGAIATQFNVLPQTVVDWYCSDHSFGEIVVALVTAEKYDVAPGPILAQRERTRAWGVLTRQLEDAPPGGPPWLSPTTEPTGTNGARPEGAGPPEGVGPPENPGPPEGAGPPEGIGPPENPGPPEGAGPPEGVGPPENPGPPEGAGPPEGVGPPENPGPPDDVGPPDRDQDGNGENNSGNNGNNRGQSNRP